VGTRSNDLLPETTRGWGGRALEGGQEVELFVDRDAGKTTVENLRSNRLIAVTFASPVTYRALQLKGWCVEIGEAAPDDKAWIERHRTAFSEALRARGQPLHVSRNLWSTDVVRVRFLVNECFDQTPGPGAGRKL
jgi:hypothetical protein